MTDLLDALITGTRHVSRVAVWIAGALLLGAVALIAVEVVMRRIGGMQLLGASELSGYMLAVTIAWAFSHTLLGRSNIRFDALYGRIPQGARATLDIVSLLALLAFMGLVTYYCVKVLLASIRLGATSNSALAMPLFIPQSLWVAGLIFLCWTLLLLTLRCFVALAQGDAAGVGRIAGIELPAEEIEREMRGLAEAGPLELNRTGA